MDRDQAQTKTEDAVLNADRKRVRDRMLRWIGEAISSNESELKHYKHYFTTAEATKLRAIIYGLWTLKKLMETGKR